MFFFSFRFEKLLPESWQTIWKSTETCSTFVSNTIYSNLTFLRIDVNRVILNLKLNNEIELHGYKNVSFWLYNKVFSGLLVSPNFKLSTKLSGPFFKTLNFKRLFLTKNRFIFLHTYLYTN